MLYRVLGFLLRSEIEFPELQPVDAAYDPSPEERVLDVSLGDVPQDLSGGVRLADWLVLDRGRCLYLLRDTGRMLVEDGKRITIELGPSAHVSDMRTYILATGLGTIIHQRGLVPLHVGAVLSPAGVIAFTGRPGAGKSTAVATISQHFGWPLVGDDLAMLSLEGDTPMLEGGVRRLRLWDDAVKRLGWRTEGMTRDLYRKDKYVTHAHGRFIDGPRPLAGIYEIVPDAENTGVASFGTLEGADKLSMLLGAVFRPFLVGPCGNHLSLHRIATRSTTRIMGWRGGRPDPALVVAVHSSIANGADELSSGATSA